MTVTGLLRALPPQRLVILGGSGFLGRHIGALAVNAGWPTLIIGSGVLDLESAGAEKVLAEMLTPGDTVVHAAAVTPAKTAADVARNMVITSVAVQSMVMAGVEHLALVSSDAVYASSSGVNDEETLPSPEDLHGIMHLGREELCSSAGFPIQVIVRPSAIYGLDDPHNAYGPNRFVRSACATDRIVVMGKGESVRDHVSVDDVAAIVALAVRDHSFGVINAVSGQAVSFSALAEEIGTLGDGRWAVVYEGYERTPTVRAYDSSKVVRCFPEFKVKRLAAGMRRLVSEHQILERLKG